LGLYLSQYFVERHGGHIGARSRQDRGATFWFTLPLEHADGADQSGQGFHDGDDEDEGER
jgi:signal transduction histidine kinase